MLSASYFTCFMQLFCYLYQLLLVAYEQLLLVANLVTITFIVFGFTVLYVKHCQSLTASSYITLVLLTKSVLWVCSYFGCSYQVLAGWLRACYPNCFTLSVFDSYSYSSHGARLAPPPAVTEVYTAAVLHPLPGEHGGPHGGNLLPGGHSCFDFSTPCSRDRLESRTRPRVHSVNCIELYVC